MKSKECIIAIEFGSSKLRAVAGKHGEEGELLVQAYAEEDSMLFVKKGIIYNIDLAAEAINRLIRKLEQKLTCTIERVYVGVSGQSIRTLKNTIIEKSDREEKLTEEYVISLNKQNTETELEEYEILHVEPQEYLINNKLHVGAVGVLCKTLEANFLNVIGKIAITSNISLAFEQTKVQIAGLFTAPLAAAEVVLSDEQKRLGCALIDFGADTTTVSVYKNNVLRHLALLPMGGSNITKDISTLQIEEREAERLKIAYGSALPRNSKEKTSYPIGSTQRTIESAKLDDITSARSMEIVLNVKHQIKLSGYGDSLLAGIVVIGAAANMQGLLGLLKEEIQADSFSFGRFQVRLVSEVGNINTHHNANTILGLLNKGEQNCCQQQKEEVLTTTLFGDQETQTVEAPGKKGKGPRKPNLIDKAKNTIRSIFED